MFKNSLMALGLSLALFGLASAQVVNVGVIGVSGEGPFYIALHKGYFKELGLDIKTHKFASAAKMMAPMAGGQLHMATSGGINVGFFNAVIRGLPIVLAAGSSQYPPGHSGQYFLLRTDLKDKVKSIKDVKGKVFALNASRSPNLYIIGKVLEANGLKLSDITLKNIPFPNMAVAFDRKAIDFAIQVEPLASLIAAKGFAVKWQEMSKLLFNPYMQISAVYFNSDWARKNSEQSRKFMVGQLRGIREYYTANEKGPNRDEVIKIFTIYTRVKNPKLYQGMQWSYIDPNGRILLESVQDQINWYHKNKYLTEKVPLNKVYDYTYLNHAISVLGEWKKPHIHRGN